MRFLMLLTLLPTLLAVMTAPARRAGSASPLLSAPRHAAPARQARELPPPGGRIPNYPAFAEVAIQNAPRWEITHQHGERAPYTVRHRVIGHILAVSDVDLLDHCLTVYEPPPAPRPYIDLVRSHAPGQ